MCSLSLSLPPSFPFSLSSPSLFLSPSLSPQDSTVGVAISFVPYIAMPTLTSARTTTRLQVGKNSRKTIPKLWPPKSRSFSQRKGGVCPLSLPVHTFVVAKLQKLSRLKKKNEKLHFFHQFFQAHCIDNYCNTSLLLCYLIMTTPTVIARSRCTLIRCIIIHVQE